MIFLIIVLSVLFVVLTFLCHNDRTLFEINLVPNVMPLNRFVLAPSWKTGRYFTNTKKQKTTHKNNAKTKEFKVKKNSAIPKQNTQQKKKINKTNRKKQKKTRKKQRICKNKKGPKKLTNRRNHCMLTFQFPQLLPVLDVLDKTGYASGYVSLYRYNWHIWILYPWQNKKLANNHHTIYTLLISCCLCIISRIDIR